MKVNKLSIIGFISTLAPCAFAHHNFGMTGPSKPLPYKHRLTAFFVKDSGVDVECWDIDTLLPSSDRQKTQQDNSKETPPATQDDDGNVSGAGLYIGAGTGVYALAWTDSVDLRSAPSIYAVNSGLILVESNSTVSGSAKNKKEQFILGPENGDSWFFIEDTSTVSQGPKDDPLFMMKPVSSASTSLIRIKHYKTPKHEVLHAGQCNFAGFKPVVEGEKDSDLGAIDLTVQELKFM